MGCGPAQPEAPHKDQASNALIIYGDHFSADTRALVAICEMAGVEHELKVVDTLAKKNFEAEFVEINPTGQIPLIIQSRNRVIASGFTLFQWVIKAYPDAAAKFFPEE